MQANALPRHERTELTESSADFSPTPDERLETAANAVISDIVNGEGFAAFYAKYLEKRGKAGKPVVDPDDMNNPLYWRAAAHYASEIYSREGIVNEDPAQAALNTLTICSLAHIFDAVALAEVNRRLESARGQNERTALLANKHALTKRVIEFNRQMKETIRLIPEMRASKLRDHMADTAANALDNERLLSAGITHLSQAVFGMQHELAFEQILDATGLPWREATESEDAEGADYVVSSFDVGTDNLPLYIDIKSTLAAVARKAGCAVEDLRGQYFQDPRKRDHITMWSGIGLEDLDGRFHIDPRVARRMALGVRRTLMQARAAIA